MLVSVKNTANLDLKAAGSRDGVVMAIGGGAGVKGQRLSRKMLFPGFGVLWFNDS